jgi:hypothetical protein
MFRPCWVIFRENSLVTLLDALVKLSENVPLFPSSVERCLVLSAALPSMIQCTDMEHIKFACALSVTDLPVECLVPSLSGVIYRVL